MISIKRDKIRHMSIIEIIKKRKSIRTFNDKQISATIIEQIRNYIKSLTPPFDAKARIELICTTMGNKPVKLGTYGVISGANYFLTLIIDKDQDLAKIAGGYIFEQTILYCTSLGLNTCWLGGTFKAKDFAQQANVRDNEQVVIISPIGYQKEKRSFIDRMMSTGAGSKNRKPYTSLFFNDNFETPLTENDKYAIPLNMVRLAPSAINKQPWRILKKGNFYHFYYIPGHFSLNDIGIALCHFEQTARELNLKGHLEFIKNISDENTMKYIITWIDE